MLLLYEQFYPCIYTLLITRISFKNKFQQREFIYQFVGVMRFPHEIYCFQIRQFKCQCKHFATIEECMAWSWLEMWVTHKWNGKMVNYGEIAIRTIFTINKYFRIPAGWKVHKSFLKIHIAMKISSYKYSHTCNAQHNHLNGSVFSHIVTEHAHTCSCKKNCKRKASTNNIPIHLNISWDETGIKWIWSTHLNTVQVFKCSNDVCHHVVCVWVLIKALELRFVPPKS